MRRGEEDRQVTYSGETNGKERGTRGSIRCKY